MFFAPLSALSSFTTWLTSFLSGSQRVLELLDTPLTIDEPSAPQEWSQPRGAIKFNNVSFGYDRNQPVLKNISFEVAAGEMVGIVGRSGSGKTTMVNLLGRFYDVQEGSITVDGIDIRQISRSQLRERLGIVFQDSFLFRGTIWKNLSYGKPNTTIEEGISAAKAAGAHDFICRQPLAYETLLGEHGAGLSGGEKQRLSIARTLLCTIRAYWSSMKPPVTSMPKPNGVFNKRWKCSSKDVPPWPSRIVSRRCAMPIASWSSIAARWLSKVHTPNS